jgi:predicted transcriptional regulator
MQFLVTLPVVSGELERRGSLVRRRSWPEITVEILEVTLSPSNKMRIMYGSNLNFERFNRYFYDLLRKGFIKEITGSDGRDKYKITEQGRTLLEVLRKAEALLFSEEY